MIHETAKIAKTAQIRCDDIKVGKHCVIGENVVIDCGEKFRLGACSVIGDRTKIVAWKFESLDYLFVKPECDFGGGSCQATPDSSIHIGRGVFVGDRSFINCARHVKIGDEVGLGAGVGIWTHGVYPPADQGFPVSFAPVEIGDRVWITGNTQVLPGVTIGDDVVISMGSLVRKDVPNGALVGGNPAKTIKEGVFPKSVDLGELLADLCKQYNKSAEWRGLGVAATYRGGTVLLLHRGRPSVEFNVPERRISGEMTEEAEDFRDFIRRNAGIRFFTGEPFRSIPHPKVVR